MGKSNGARQRRSKECSMLLTDQKRRGTVESHCFGRKSNLTVARCVMKILFFSTFKNIQHITISTFCLRELEHHLKCLSYHNKFHPNLFLLSPLYLQVQTGRRNRGVVKSSALLRRHPGPTSVRNRVSLQGRLRPLLHQPRHPVLLPQSFRGLLAEADVTLCLVTLQKHTQ